MDNLVCPFLIYIRKISLNCTTCNSTCKSVKRAEKRKRKENKNSTLAVIVERTVAVTADGTGWGEYDFIASLNLHFHKKIMNK